MWTQVGERIKKIRKEHNLSKAEFGKLIGITGQYVGMIERGNSLSVDTIIKICRTMNVSADFILFGTVNITQDTVKITTLQGLSNEQIRIALDIIEKVAQFINTENGNEILIQEVANQQNPDIT